MSAQDADWSKAPEGATHYLAENKKHGWFACWYKYGSNEWLCMSDSNRHRWLADNDDVELFEPMLIKRPAPAWNGEGLPPVGTVCEWEHAANKGNWHKAEIKYIGSAYVIVADLAGFEQHYYLQTMQFRPIRTIEQVAKDEREAFVESMLLLDPYLPNTQLGMMSRADFCRTLYDAGYRRQSERAK